MQVKATGSLFASPRYVAVQRNSPGSWGTKSAEVAPAPTIGFVAVANGVTQLASAGAKIEKLTSPVGEKPPVSVATSRTELPTVPALALPVNPGLARSTVETAEQGASAGGFPESPE